MIRKALGFLSFGAVLFAFSPASAEETKKVEKDEANAKEEKPEADEHAGIAYADFVLGFGKVPLAVIENPPTTTVAPALRTPATGILRPSRSSSVRCTSSSRRSASARASRSRSRS